jgi:hypothetical protein
MRASDDGEGREMVPAPASVSRFPNRLRFRATWLGSCVPPKPRFPTPYEIQPGHDGWVVGDEAVTSIELAGAERYPVKA